MNKIFAKRGLRPLVTLFVVLGAMFFAATSASAQVGSIEVVQPQELLSPNDAVNKLMSELQQIRQALPGLTGSNYTNKVMRAQYYKEIIVSVNNGENVPQSLRNALEAAIILDETKVSLPAGIVDTLEVIYWETVNLLKV